MSLRKQLNEKRKYPARMAGYSIYDNAYVNPRRETIKRNVLDPEFHQEFLDDLYTHQPGLSNIDTKDYALTQMMPLKFLAANAALSAGMPIDYRGMDSNLTRPLKKGAWFTPESESMFYLDKPQIEKRKSIKINKAKLRKAKKLVKKSRKLANKLSYVNKLNKIKI